MDQTEKGDMLLHCLAVLSCVFGWMHINNAMKKVNDQYRVIYSHKQLDNFISVIHNAFSIVLTLYYYMWSEKSRYVSDYAVIHCMVLWSQSYYVYDILKYWTNPSKHLVMIAHHIVSTIGVMSMSNPNRAVADVVIYGMAVAELSNYPMYWVYHLKHNMTQRFIDPKWYIYETISFVLFRGIFGIYNLVLYPVQNSHVWFIVFGICSMSILWAKGTYDQYVHTQSSDYWLNRV